MAREMTLGVRFLIGGAGGLLPSLVSLLSYDLASLIDHLDLLTTGVVVGYLIRVAILFGLGGTLASLNRGIGKPIALLQVGIAAPALITSFINGSSVAGPPRTGNVALISSAFAAEVISRPEIVPADFVRDVVRGMVRPLPTIQKDEAERRLQSTPQPPSKAEGPKPPPTGSKTPQP